MIMHDCEHMSKLLTYVFGSYREMTEAILSMGQPGLFLVRRSTTQPGALVLSLVTATAEDGDNTSPVVHYLIVVSHNRWRIKVLFFQTLFYKLI
jgi:hypothetical protein